MQTGDRFRSRWQHAALLEGEFTNIVLDGDVASTFGSTHVAARSSPVGDQTGLHLLQTGIADTPEGRVLRHLDCRSCGILFLVRLKSILEAERDLREANPERASSIEVGFEALSRKQPGAGST